MNSKNLLRKLAVFGISAAVLTTSSFCQIVPAATPAETYQSDSVALHASKKTDKENIEKVFKYYKKGKYSTAKKYNNKISKNADTSCTKNLSKKAKKAYAKKIKSYKFYTIEDDNDGIKGAYLADMDGDKKAELIIEHGHGPLDTSIDIFTYSKGKVQYIANFPSCWSHYYAYPGQTGIMCVECHMGYEDIFVLTVDKNGKLQTRNMAFREDVESNNEYFPFRQKLYDHLKHDKLYDITGFDLKDLK